jgi:hypothetical protein
LFHDFTEPELRDVLGGTAIKCYGLDRTHLAAIASRIGPRPSDVLGDFELDAVHLDNFNHRAGFSKPAVLFERDDMVRALEEDIAALATRT